MERIRKNWKAILATLSLLVLSVGILIAQNRIAPGPYGYLFRSNTATDTATLTTTQFAPGILVGTPTAGATYTLPTAANICSAFPQIAQVSGGTNTNFGYEIFIRNVSGGSNTITLGTATGITLASGNTNTVAQNHTRGFLVVPTACPSPTTGTPTAAVTVYSLQDSAH